MNNRKTVLNILMDLVFLLVFNVVFFVLGGTEHSSGVWLSYCFIHFSYLMVLLTPFLTRRGSSRAIFGMAIASVSSAYFLIEFIVGVAFVIIKPDSYKIPLVVQVIIAGIYLIILLANMLANESTADNQERQQAEHTFIKAVSSRVKMLVDKLDDKAANKKIEKLYDLIHSSPSKSNAAATPYENEVVNRTFVLENAVANGDSATSSKVTDEIISLMEQRNRRVKMN